MSLQAGLFKGDPWLEACLIQHSAHITLGATGEHVRKIQMALRNPNFSPSAWGRGDTSRA